MGRIIIDFFGALLLIAILLAVVSYFFPSFGGSGGAVTTVVAALVAGQFYGRRTGQPVSSGFAWKVAAVLTVLSLALAALILWYVVTAGVPVTEDGNALSSLSPQVLLLVFGFLGLISLLGIRFMFSMGVKQGIKSTT